MDKYRLISFLFIIFSCLNYSVQVQSATLNLNRSFEIPENLFPVSIIHINDFHARFEETNDESTGCRPEEGQKCIGGYGRVVTMVKHLFNIRRDSNPIYLNAGDNFQGTLWYNLGRWNVTSHFLNLLPADVMTIGNHEFDNQIDGVVPFLERINSPIVISNIDDSLEPTFQGKYQKSFVIDWHDRKIGVIGVILKTTNLIASTGKLIFLDEAESVRQEATKLKEQGINIIIVLSHCGLDVDYRIARDAGPDIDVIVGGHSHTFMYTGDNPPGPDTPRDNYPAVVTHDDGHKVLIVQASAYTKYLGDLTVYFDEDGHVENWEGYPIFLDSDIVPDEDIVRELKPWKEFIDIESLREVGQSKVDISNSGCYYAECSLGNLVTDAFVNHYVEFAEDNEWTYAPIGITNAGGLRTTLRKGVLTFGDLVSAIPFENTLDTFEFRGDHLLEMLEYMVFRSREESNFSPIHMLQVSGLKVTFNITNEPYNRVVSALALCNKCLIPEYKPINSTEMYRMVVPSFLSNGGSEFYMFPEYAENFKGGVVDINAFESYVQRMSPIIGGLSERITFLT